MARIEKTVFISYRRKDMSWALAVYQYLQSQKYDVFFDFSSLSSGDFGQVIVSNIKARAHFVLILTPTALDRCSEPGDWLRREVEIAIDEKRNVIPLFFDGFNFGSPSVTEKLTGKLGAINRYNGLDIPSGYFMEAMQRLSDRYLNVPLEAVIHPVSTEVRKVVKEEQVAADKALIQKSEDIKELVKPAEEKLEGFYSPSRSGVWGNGKIPNLRRYGIGTVILLLALLGVFSIRGFIQNVPAKDTPTPASQLVSTTTKTSVPPTQTRLVSTSTETSIPSTPTVMPTPTLEIGSTMVSLKDGMIMVYVPAGPFKMGSEGQKGDAKPVHTVYLDAYWIDQTEVTNAMYAKCVNDNGCNRPNSSSPQNHYGISDFDNHPVIFVSWDYAHSYCEWADRKLPTEAEWEKAARGTEQRTYPWKGEKIDCSYANYYNGNNYCTKDNNGKGDTSPVKSYESGVSLYGLYDLAGNVWEWVADLYGETYYKSLPSPSSNPTGPTSGHFRVARGGSWYNGEFLMQSANRGAFENNPTSTIGFRCAMDASE